MTRKIRMRLLVCTGAYRRVDGADENGQATENIFRWGADGGRFAAALRLRSEIERRSMADIMRFALTNYLFGPEVRKPSKADDHAA